MPLTDFFLASDAELRAACPGWKDPLPAPVKRQGVNPFTKQPLEYWSSAPDPGEPFPPEAVPNADLRGLHRVDLKGLGTVEMEELMRITLGASDEEVADVYHVPLFGPRGSEQAIFRVPPALVARLAEMSEDDRLERADTWSAGDVYLEPLGELARKAVAEQRQVFMWLSP